MPEPWLVVVDMQHVFGRVGSPWYLPTFAATAARIGALLPRFGSRAVFTRFVPPELPEGSWTEYYERWSFAPGTQADPIWSLVPPWDGVPTHDTHRFSKWDTSLRTQIGAGAAVICGVSTDCCVLSTALAAMDDGAAVRVVADACGAKTPALHDGALALLATRSPQLAITTVARELALATEPNEGKRP